MPALGPRLVVAGTHSGAGKTTVATGLMAALRRRGLTVAGAKVGPDFIDPGYHALATGRAGRNLDPWICGEETVVALAGRAGAGADVLVVEGVMGMFDGAAEPERPAAAFGPRRPADAFGPRRPAAAFGPRRPADAFGPRRPADAFGPRRPADAFGPRRPVASTASVATLLDAPVVLVVDASALSGSVAALVHGYASWDPSVRVAGVVLNRVGSDSHEAMLRAALSPLGLPVLGVLRRDDALRWRDRHLGLVPVVEEESRVRGTLTALGATVDRCCDVEALMRVARTAPRRTVAEPPRARPSGRARVAVLGGRSFSFSYPDNLELLEEAGAEIVPVDPEVDDRLPPGVDSLYAGGGFPEVFAARLAANRPLLDDVGRRVAGGLVTWAECGGLLWLARSLDGHRMAGAVPADTRMTDRLTLGYRRSRPLVDTPLAPAGAELRGHEFHYSECEPGGDALEWRGREGGGRNGFASPALLASYLHLHLAADAGLAERFVAMAGAARVVSD